MNCCCCPKFKTMLEQGYIYINWEVWGNESNPRVRFSLFNHPEFSHLTEILFCPFCGRSVQGI